MLLKTTCSPSKVVQADDSIRWVRQFHGLSSSFSLEFKIFRLYETSRGPSAIAEALVIKQSRCSTKRFQNVIRFANTSQLTTGKCRIDVPALEHGVQFACDAGDHVYRRSQYVLK